MRPVWAAVGALASVSGQVTVEVRREAAWPSYAEWRARLQAAAAAAIASRQLGDQLSRPTVALSPGAHPIDGPRDASSSQAPLSTGTDSAGVRNR